MTFFTHQLLPVERESAAFLRSAVVSHSDSRSSTNAAGGHLPRFDHKSNANQIYTRFFIYYISIFLDFKLFNLRIILENEFETPMSFMNEKKSVETAGGGEERRRAEEKEKNWP